MKCFFTHNWSKWKETERGKLVKRDSYDRQKEIITGHYLIQERTCEVCGKTELDKQRTD